MPVRTCRWVKRNTSGRAGDFDETWIRFQLDPTTSGGEPETRDVTVTLSADLIQKWRLSQEEGGRVMFWAGVHRGLVEGSGTVDLKTDNATPHCPEEWKRPEPPKGETFDVEFPARTIGFGG